jgi:tRNA(fMet)-specific endonuclease VapC
MIYLLDTDHLSLWQRGTTEGERIRERVRQLAPDDYGITIVTYAEQAKGWLASVAQAQTQETEVFAFRKMQQSLRFCTAFAIWGYTIALANGATLLTRNTQDFSRIPNLRFADWSV